MGIEVICGCLTMHWSGLMEQYFSHASGMPITLIPEELLHHDEGKRPLHVPLRRFEKALQRLHVRRARVIIFRLFNCLFNILRIRFAVEATCADSSVSARPLPLSLPPRPAPFFAKPSESM